MSRTTSARSTSFLPLGWPHGDGAGVAEGGDGQDAVAPLLGVEGHLDDDVVDARVGDDDEEVLGVRVGELVEARGHTCLALQERVVENARVVAAVEHEVGDAQAVGGHQTSCAAA